MSIMRSSEQYGRWDHPTSHNDLGTELASCTGQASLQSVEHPVCGANWAGWWGPVAANTTITSLILAISAGRAQLRKAPRRISTLFGSNEMFFLSQNQ